MSKIFWDTMLFVYWLEDNPQFGPQVARIYSRMRERGDRLITSALAVGELLVLPYKSNASETVERIQRFFDGPLVEVLPFTHDTARHYARIRARLTIRPPDAVHLACAATAGTDLFLTNDASLVGKNVPGIHFIAGLNTDLF
jgi:predicted nucleic acid-binding protein